MEQIAYINKAQYIALNTNQSQHGGLILKPNVYLVFFNGTYQYKVVNYPRKKVVEIYPFLMYYEEFIEKNNLNNEQLVSTQTVENPTHPFRTCELYTKLYDKKKCKKVYPYYDEYLKQAFGKMILRQEYDEIFIGNSTSYCYDDSNHSNDHIAQYFIGNTILLGLGKNKYMYIEQYISTFQTSEPIVQYDSMVGNNDVAYPVARTNNQIFLISYGTYFNKKELKKIDDHPDAECFKKDPYQIFNHDMKKTIKTNIFKMKKLHSNQINQN